jgi:hypothetical protein
MTILVLLAVWFVLSPVVALACGALIRAGQGPDLDQPLGTGAGHSGDPGPRAASGREDLAA